MSDLWTCKLSALSHVFMYIRGCASVSPGRPVWKFIGRETVVFKMSCLTKITHELKSHFILQ